MSSLTHDEARRLIARYLAGEVSLRELRDLFDRLAWELAERSAEDGASSALEQLVYDVALALAEYSSGHRNRRELRAALAPLITTYGAPLGTGARRLEERGISPTLTVTSRPIAA